MVYINSNSCDKYRSLVIFTYLQVLYRSFVIFTYLEVRPGSDNFLGDRRFSQRLSLMRLIRTQQEREGTSGRAAVKSHHQGSGQVRDYDRDGIPLAASGNADGSRHWCHSTVHPDPLHMARRVMRGATGAVVVAGLDRARCGPGRGLSGGQLH